jgi:uncharacterized protein (DUF1330 family)
MPSGFVEITDPKLYDTYSSKAIASVEKYKGEFVVRGGRYQRLVHIPAHGVHGFQRIVNADSNGT